MEARLRKSSLRLVESMAFMVSMVRDIMSIFNVSMVSNTNSIRPGSCTPLNSRIQIHGSKAISNSATNQSLLFTGWIRGPMICTTSVAWSKALSYCDACLKIPETFGSGISRSAKDIVTAISRKLGFKLSCQTLANRRINPL